MVPVGDDIGVGVYVAVTVPKGDAIRVGVNVGMGDSNT